MLDQFGDLVMVQIANLGLGGVLISFMAYGMRTLWQELQDERKKSAELVAKMLEISKETSIMIERITSGR